MKPLIFYTNPFSRGRIVRWMLEELGMPYETKIMEFGTTIKSPDYLAINPMGKVPALVHGDTVVTEVVAICAYLADLLPEKKLAPPIGSPERGTYYRWLFFAAGPMEMAATAIAYDWEISSEMASSVGCGRVKDVVTTLEKTLENGDYLCGDHFTAADLVLGSYLGWEISQGHMESLPVFSRYVDRVSNREAAKRADALDNALAKSA